MRSGLSFVLWLGAAPPSSGQFLRSWSGGYSYSSSGEASSWSSSFSRFSTVTRGAHGGLHEQVQESRSERLSNDQGIQRLEARTVCADGLCKQKIAKAAQVGSSSGAVQWPETMPSRIQALMERFVSPRVAVAVPEPEQFAPQEQHIVAPNIRIIVAIPMEPMAVRVRPALRGHPIVVSDAGSGRTQLEPTVGDVPPAFTGAMMRDFQMIACFYVGLIVSMLSSLLLLSKCWSGQGASAREVQAQTLAEPLAPTEDAPHALPAAARAPQAPKEVASSNPSQKYLLGLYGRVQERLDISLAKTQRKGIEQYLRGLYQRVAM